MFSGAKPQDVTGGPPPEGYDQAGPGFGAEGGDNRQAWGGKSDAWKETPGQISGYTPSGIPIYSSAPSYTHQASGRATDVQRYQGLGEAAAQRQAYQQNYGEYDRSMRDAASARGQQQDALSMQRDAALGTAPSKAEILGRQMSDQGMASQLSMAASARGGGLAQAAAMHQAQAGQGAYMQQAQAQMSGLRAEEMSNARNAYMAGASGIRAGDYQDAGMGLSRVGQETQNEQFQRGLNQQAQMGYEQMGWQTNKAALDAGLQSRALDSGNAQFAQQMYLADQQRGDQMLAAGMQTGGTVIAGMASDERAKDGVMYLGPEPDGKQARWDDAGPRYVDEQANPLRARISSEGGSAPLKASIAHAAASAKRGGMSLDEMAAWADRERAKVAEQEANALKAGPAIRGGDDGRISLPGPQHDRTLPGPQRSLPGPQRGEAGLAQAARAMAPAAYAYKPEFRPPDQAPGEPNIGPIAQNMAADPMSATAVKRDPGTGMLTIDRDKAQKLTMGIVASQQRQLDQLRAELARRGG